MIKYRLAQPAADDLFDIWSFIARDNREAADQFEISVYRNCELLADTPLIGREQTDLAESPLRFWVVHPYKSYLIVYDPTTRPLGIIRILHGARNLPFIVE
jgi:plasmid stabilization system protein ParE